MAQSYVSSFHTNTQASLASVQDNLTNWQASLFSAPAEETKKVSRPVVGAAEPSPGATPEPSSRDAFRTAEYYALSAQAKLEAIWTQVTATAGTHGTYPALDTIFTANMTTSYTNNGDAMPGTKIKHVHSVGAVGKMSWIPNANAAAQISGVLAEPTDTVILRLAAAIQPAANEAPIRSTSWKFLRDGMGSGNTLANEVNITPNNWNWFSDMYSTHTEWGPKGQAVVDDPINKYFSPVSQEIKQVGLSELAAYDSKGNKVEKPIFPWLLNFRINSAVASEPFGYTTGDENIWLDRLEAVPANSPLFDVYAQDLPSELGGVETHIGTMVLNGSVTTAKWQDDNLYFQHFRMDDDIAIKPEWSQFANEYKLGGFCPYQKTLKKLNLW